jgi:DNA replication initiation complex subunit (GINS family)
MHVIKIKMITYAEIYEILRKEKYNENLQPLPKNFMSEIKSYFSEKKAVSNRESDMFSDEIKKSKKQLENAIEIIKELTRRREEKVLRLAVIAAKIGISKKDIENMLDTEKDLFTIVAEKIENAEKKLHLVIQGIHEETFQNDLVKFNQDIPEVLGQDSKVLGPFKKGDIANLPKDIATIFIDSKQATLIEN